MNQHDFICEKDKIVVETKQGKLRGFYRDGVYQFWGIRYATARRFHMPEEPESWSGIKNAMAYGYVSPLLTDPLPEFELTVPHRFWPEGEDCLNLNIATPSIDKHAKKAVMVWFHGGGFSDGSAIAHIAFEGDNMARNHDVVMVCVNHRLNAFGFLDLSAYGEEYKNSGNAGMADLVAALKWIKENIASFGGDPGNVTIFGQSGGGAKVTTLGQTPDADGLFQKAIVMSGVFDSGKMVDFPEADASMLVPEILRELHLDDKDIHALEKVDHRLFIMAVNRAIVTLGRKGYVVGWHPHANDWYLGDPFIVGFREHFKKIPLIIGSTIGEFVNSETSLCKWNMTQEAQLQVVKDKYGEENARRILELYKEAYPGKNLAYAAFLDNIVRPGSVKYALLKSTETTTKNYIYLMASTFDFETGMPAWHNCDIPFVFGNADIIQYCSATKNAEELSFVMPASFAAFAKNGDPNIEELPKWEAVSENCAPTMIFDEVITCKAGHDIELIAFIDSITGPVSFGVHEPVTEEQQGHQWTY